MVVLCATAALTSHALCKPEQAIVARHEMCDGQDDDVDESMEECEQQVSSRSGLHLCGLLPRPLWPSHLDFILVFCADDECERGFTNS